MKSILKAFIAGIVIIAIGAGIIIATLAANDWSFRGPDFEMKTYTEQNENSTVKIKVGAGILKTEFYDGDKIEIIYPDSKAYKNGLDETDGTLSFDSSIKWYASIFSFGLWNAPETVVRLPANRTLNISLDMNAGKVELAAGTYGRIDADVSAGMLSATGINCSKLYCDVSAGTVHVNNTVCPDIEIDISAGTLKLGVNGKKSEYTVKVDVSAGTCNLSDQTGTTDKRLFIDCSAGTVKVDFSE